ncbi:hypothetical protein GGR56DRAFT_114026 [Xylariaceae sp. FL0804]|nr:hypothetical protein GGR56DRAFT_114026 [Xylariaceae sp. FL0804]
MSESAHPDKGPIGGQNPDYYAASSGSGAGGGGDTPLELPADVPHPLHSHPPESQQQQQHQHQQQYFPPPPPGPPPSGGPYQQQQYYPPPPPGPPPPSSSSAGQQQQQYYAPPPPAGQEHDEHHHYDDEEELPPYTPMVGDGTGSGPALTVSDHKPPVLPPRPVSAQGQGQGSGQGQQQVPQFFPPPPVSPSRYHPGGGGGGVGVGGASASSSGDGQHLQPGQQGASSSSASSGKQGWSQKLYQWSLKAGVPINKVTNKLGSEAFWPTSMDKECDKAARILKSFCKDGFYTTSSNRPPPSPGHATSPGPSSSGKTLVKIPAAAVAQARGLAIFTTFRTGLHISGAGGSGVVVARLPDNTWSPPSGFLVHTLGAGFMVGLDIYDCVCVLNTQAAVDAFVRPRVSLGGEVAVVAGPVGAGGGVDAALARGGKPVWSYMKSRGLYAGVQADGTVIVQRPGANAAFYGEEGGVPPTTTPEGGAGEHQGQQAPAQKKLDAERILRGQVTPHPGVVRDGVALWPDGARQLVEVLKAAEGRGADATVMREVGEHPTPGDLAPAAEGQGQDQGHGHGHGHK